MLHLATVRAWLGLTCNLLLLTFLRTGHGADLAQVQAWIDEKGPASQKALSCEGGCPEWLAVVRLYLETPASLDEVAREDHACTGVLISPDELLTNAHCQPRADLVPFVRVQFAATTTRPAETVSVRSVRVRAAYAVTPTQDVMTLKLARPVTRAPLRWAGGPARREQTVSVFNLADTLRGGKLVTLAERRRCQVERDSQVSGMDAFNVVLRLNGCTVARGSSGGPVLDSEERALGITWGAMPSSVVGVLGICVAEASPLRTHSCVSLGEDLAFSLAQRDRAMQVALQRYFRVEAALTWTNGRVHIGLRPLCFKEKPPANFTANLERLTLSSQDLVSYVPVGQALQTQSTTIEHRFQVTNETVSDRSQGSEGPSASPVNIPACGSVQ